MDLLTPFLQIAVTNAAKHFHVHPLWPGEKRPLTEHGWHDATTHENQIRDWWIKWPDANVGIACGPSNLCVLDIDHGLTDESSFLVWRETVGLPETYAVRTGRRPEFGVQMYYSGAIPDVSFWTLNGCEGQIKSLGGYVLAAGSLHPSGETYQVLCEASVAGTPDIVRQLRAEKAASGKDAGPITVNRNIELTSIAGKLRNAGLSKEAMEVALLQVNDDRCVPPLDDDEVKHIAASVARYDVPEPEPEIILGDHAPETKATDWRDLFHSRDEMLHAPPISFLIKDYLMCEGVTAIAAPVRERKSLIALNVAYALLTGEKLFDHFEVVKKPSRVLYLCPEVSLGPFTDRLRKIGLMNFVGDRLFCRTLSAEGHLTLNAPELVPALPGSVVILDTAIRFLEGDENSSKDVRAFADSMFALLRAGAESVVMLHHSPKDAGDVMTLENAMRGSGDMGAFLACCWGTRLQDPTKPYESASFLSNLKQRDFESKDFEVTSGSDCRLHIVGDPALNVATLAPRRRGNVANKDGKDEVAVALIKANPKLSIRKMVELLKENGIKRGKDWVQTKRYELVQKNGGQMP
jgi:hypothetical protein